MQRGRDERGSSGTACVDRHHHFGADGDQCGGARQHVFDYAATGLPKAGDQVPLGERVLVDNAHSASLEVQLSFPLAPLFPKA